MTAIIKISTLQDWENHLNELPFMVQVQIPFAFEYIVKSDDKRIINRYIQVCERLIPIFKEERFRAVVKDTIERYKKSL